MQPAAGRRLGYLYVDADSQPGSQASMRVASPKHILISICTDCYRVSEKLTRINERFSIIQSFSLQDIQSSAAIVAYVNLSFVAH
jgi:hypothetical protein